MRLRPIKTAGFVWCDYHGEIHAPKVDHYDEDVGEYCNRENWRSVYVAGEPGEEFD